MISNIVIQTQMFEKYFTGLPRCYVEGSNPVFNETKQKYEYTYKNKKGLSFDNYLEHVKGNVSIAVNPLLDNKDDPNICHCNFAAIDLDLYDYDYTDTFKTIEDFNFPLIPFKTKSGGHHLYIFFNKPENAENVRNIMQQFCFYLSLDRIHKEHKEPIEIFPKQSNFIKVPAGSFINLPYFGGDETKRYAIKDGLSLSMTEAFSLIEQKKTSLEKIKNLFDSLPYSDAPPCLQTLYLLDPFEGGEGRQNYLFNFGVYLKNKDANLLETELVKINEHLRNPKEQKDIDGIIKSLEKTYYYKCKDKPCAYACNKEICKSREFGLGKKDGYFSNIEIGSLRQLQGIGRKQQYELEVRHIDLENKEKTEFTKIIFRDEKELMDQSIFCQLCISQLKKYAIRIKNIQYDKILEQAINNMEIIELSSEEDTSFESRLCESIREWFLYRQLAHKKSQLHFPHNRSSFYEGATKQYFFKIKHLHAYLLESQFFRSEDLILLRNLLEKKFFATYKRGLKDENRKGIGLWVIEKSYLSRSEDSETEIEEEEETIEVESFKDELSKYDEDGDF